MEDSLKDPTIKDLTLEDVLLKADKDAARINAVALFDDPDDEDEDEEEEG